VSGSGDVVDGRSPAVVNAIQLLTRVTKEAPGLMSAHILLAKTKQSSGDPDGALRALSTVRARRVRCRRSWRLCGARLATARAGAGRARGVAGSPIPPASFLLR
jgi:hypothetical protein